MKKQTKKNKECKEIKNKRLQNTKEWKLKYWEKDYWGFTLLFVLKFLRTKISDPVYFYVREGQVFSSKNKNLEWQFKSSKQVFEYIDQIFLGLQYFA